MSESVTAKITLSAVLANVAAELEQLALKASEIDDAVGDVLASRSDEGGGIPVVLLQDVDLLRQTLDCLQILVSNISQQQDCEGSVCSSVVAEGVYLGAVRQRCLKT